MKSIKSIVLLQALLGIIAIDQQIEQGDGRKIIIVLTGQRIEEPVVSTTPQHDTSNFREKKQKKERWLQHWVKRMMLSKKVVYVIEVSRLMLSIISSSFLCLRSVPYVEEVLLIDIECGIARKICRREIDISVNLHSCLLYLFFT